jgi:hypothetical protein
VPAPGEPRREDAEWYRNLPPALQDEYRRLWDAEIARRVQRVERRRRLYWRGAASGALVFVVTHLMFGFGGLAGIGAALVVGAALGAVWELWDAGPMKCAVSAVAIYTPVWLSSGAGTGAGRFLAPVWGLAAVIVMSLGGVAGTLRELHRDDTA